MKMQNKCAKEIHLLKIESFSKKKSKKSDIINKSKREKVSLDRVK